jgi:serine/threonine protein kinase
MKSLAPNTLLQNRYLIVHLIGKGGMGDVYLAVDQRLGSAVALKRTFFSDDEMLGSAFEREAKTLARLRHPVLPKVSDHFSENDQQFLVMEHISGDDLAKRLEAAQKPFPVSWVLFWADQLLDALAYLHSNEPQIIHRDIKPQNLKLTDENSIILLDFGLSKNTTGETKPMTGSTGSVVGYTPHYAPMEQIRGTGTNPRSDIYALSATLYQLLTNIVPFDALTRADALLNGMPDPVKPINELNLEVPKAVSDVILKGMEISQDRRYPNAREMQKALREAFAQIQNAMTAQTVAFNIQNQPIQPHTSQPNSPTNQKTEVLDISSIPGQTPSQPVNYNSAPQPQNSNSAPNQNSVPTPNFDATLKMDDLPSDSLPKKETGESFSKQSDVKTEVFLAADVAPLIPPKPFESFEEEKEAENDFAVSGDFSSGEENFENNSSPANTDALAPNATVPLFSIDSKANQTSSQPDDSAFYTSPNVAGHDAYATFTPTREYTVPENFSDESYGHEDNGAGEYVRAEEYDSQPVQPAEKKSSSKALAIVGGIFALFVLAIGAAGAGWLIYNNYNAEEAVEKPTPTPAPTVEFSPTPAPTVEAAIETNTNSDNSNAEVVSGNTNGAANSGSNQSTDNTTVAEKPKAPTSTPQSPAATRPTPPQTATKTTPVKTAPTQTKPAVKPTPKKNDGPQILQ